jgi:peptidyl-prolyl cis-trans isomerase D
MLDNFRNNMRGVALVIVIFIGGIFAFSGTGSLFVSTAGTEAVLVINGEQVSDLRVRQVLSSEKQRILQENEGLDPALLDDELIRPQVINQIISRKVMAQAAESQGLLASSKKVSELLLTAESFQVDGRFDQAVFDYAIRNLGYTSASFLDMVNEDLVIQQFAQGMVQTSFVTRTEMANLARFTEQARDYYYLTLPMAPITDSVTVSEAQVAKYYEANSAQYQTQVEVSVEAIELSAAQLAAAQTVTEKQIQARFDQESADRDTADMRQAAHILLIEGAEEKLQIIQAALDVGDDFADLAKEYSEDFASAEMGGELGFSAGDTFPEAFEAALDQLEIGQVSGPVQTDAGTHLIKLLDRQAQSFDLATERMRIEQDLLREAASDVLVEKLEMLKELSFNAETLAEVATDLGLELQITEPFSRAGGAGVASFPVVVKAAFSTEVLDDKYASEVLDLGDDRYVVIKLNEYYPARQKELAEVESQVSAALTSATAQQLIADKGAALLAKIESGESVESVAKANNLDWQVAQASKRNSMDVNPEVRAAVFGMPNPGEEPVISGFYLRNGDYVVASLNKVTPGTLAGMSKQQRVSLVSAVQSVNGSRDLQAYQSTLMSEADIVQ